MDAKIQKQLLEAKELFYSWRMVEAYNLFRRYFDRIPFRPEPGHAEYISTFTRILAELGKTRELGFYLSELERHFEKTKDPSIAFVLGVVYDYSDEPRQEAARKTFEYVISASTDENLRSKAKMFLAHYYSEKKDVSACRKLIDSIPFSEDPRFQVLVEIWKAKVLREEKKFDEAILKINQTLSQLSAEKNWYAYFVAKLIHTSLMVLIDKPSQAKTGLHELRELFKGRHFKSVEINLKSLEAMIAEKNKLPFERKSEDEGLSFFFKGKIIPLKPESAISILFEKLLDEKYLSRESIISILYDRNYDPEKDPKLIYYHIHNLRKKLDLIGAPEDTILTGDDGYRLSPQVILEDI